MGGQPALYWIFASNAPAMSWTTSASMPVGVVGSVIIQSVGSFGIASASHWTVVLMSQIVNPALGW